MKRMLSLLLLLIAGVAVAQPTEQELRKLWGKEVQAIIEMDKDGIRSQCAPYVGGEWGWVIGLESNEDEWSIDDLIGNAELIFDEELRENLRYGDPSMLELFETDEGLQVHLAIFSSFEEDGEIYESATILVYDLIDGEWKLIAIQYAG